MSWSSDTAGLLEASLKGSEESWLASILMGASSAVRFKNPKVSHIMRKLIIVYEEHPLTTPSVAFKILNDWLSRSPENVSRLKKIISGLKGRKLEVALRRFGAQICSEEDEKLEEELKKESGEENFKKLEEEIEALVGEPIWERIRRLVAERIKGVDPAHLKVYVDSTCDDKDIAELKEERGIRARGLYRFA